jgi:hypothetical protein
MESKDSMKLARSEGYDYACLHGYDAAMAANPYSDDRHRLAFNRGAFQAFQDTKA